MAQSAERNLAVVRAMIAAWDRRDADAVADLFAPDGMLHSMMSAPLVGRAAIRGQVRFLLDNTSRMKIAVRTLAVTGDTVFLERWDEFTFRGHDGRVPVVGVLEIAGDHVREWRDYYDRAELLAAMGLPADS